MVFTDLTSYHFLQCQIEVQYTMNVARVTCFTDYLNGRNKYYTECFILMLRRCMRPGTAVERIVPRHGRHPETKSGQR